MLISHRKKFIFTKTVKTASTSVEVLFEPYCMAKGEWQLNQSPTMYVSKCGIIGMRAARPEAMWYNHMPAKAIQQRLAPDIWDSYMKFTTIRNPFDKMISGYFMFSGRKRPLEKTERVEDFRAWLTRLVEKYKVYENAIHDSNIAHYDIPIDLAIFDRNKYMIDGKIVVDRFIRFEHLAKDLETLCTQLDIDFSDLDIPNLKTGIRDTKIPIAEYYDADTENLVQQLYEWEIAHFDYRMP